MWHYYPRSIDTNLGLGVNWFRALSTYGGGYLGPVEQLTCCHIAIVNELLHLNHVPSVIEPIDRLWTGVSVGEMRTALPPPHVPNSLYKCFHSCCESFDSLLQ